MVATAIVLHALGKRGDRDLMERRVRTCSEYLECVGDMNGTFDAAVEDPDVLEQAWLDARRLCREIRLSGWVFSPAARSGLLAVAEDLERSDGLWHSGGSRSSARAAQLLSEKYREVRRILRGEMARAEREYLAPRIQRGERGST